MEQHAIADIERGCGSSRDLGGAYWELGFSEGGQSMESFLICPPPPMDIKKLGLAPQGVKLILVETGTYHVLDWIGAIHYPNVTDFLEEVRLYGLSRRLELSKDQYALLTKESRLIAIHPAGHIATPGLYWANRIGMNDKFFDDFYSWDYCPCDVPEHKIDIEKIEELVYQSNTLPMCAGLWWEDVLFTDPIEKKSRLSIRTMPSFKYRCALPPEGKHVHQPAVIASFPLGRIAIVEDPEGQTHLEKAEKLSDLNSEITLDFVEA